MDNKKTITIKDGDNRWKKVTIGGVSGIVVGAVGAAVASSIPLDADAAETEETDTNAPLADGVSDGMSFGDAFHAARQEVGPGGVFEWHGNLYNTYTAEEWEAMNSEERQAVAESIDWDGHSYTPLNNDQADNNHNASPQKQQEETVYVQEEEEEEEPLQTVSEEEPVKVVSDDDDDTGLDALGLDGKVEVIEVVSVENENGDGNRIMGSTVINGHSAVFIDNDGEDGEFELLAVDVNDNQQLDEGEVVDISDAHVKIEELQELANNDVKPGDDVETVTPEKEPIDDGHEVTGLDDPDETMPDYLDDNDSAALT